MTSFEKGDDVRLLSTRGTPKVSYKGCCGLFGAYSTWKGWSHDFKAGNMTPRYRFCGPRLSATKPLQWYVHKGEFISQRKHGQTSSVGGQVKARKEGYLFLIFTYFSPFLPLHCLPIPSGLPNIATVLRVTVCGGEKQRGRDHAVM
jgi:hypothetical protein